MSSRAMAEADHRWAAEADHRMGHLRAGAQVGVHAHVGHAEGAGGRREAMGAGRDCRTVGAVAAHCRGPGERPAWWSRLTGRERRQTRKTC